MRTLPTADEMIANAMRELDIAYHALSNGSDWLHSDWRPIGTALTDEQADKRARIREAIRLAKSAINEAKR